MASQRERPWVASTRFRGVGSQTNGRWNGQVSHLGKNLTTGTFDTEDEAAHARDK